MSAATENNMDQQTHHRSDPYCANCGYSLIGATESARCPECGRPLVEVLMRPAFEQKGGKRWASRTRVFGMPLVHIATGSYGEERVGRAKGFIAIGDVATGVVAIGGQARGVVALGGLAIGGFTAGGLSIGLFTSLGGFALGGLALGGFAVGGIAQGGGALGYVAQGGMAIGHYARGGGAFGTHVIRPGGTASPEAQAMFDNLLWLLGGSAPNVQSLISALAIAATPMLGVLLICGIIALLAFGRSNESEAVS